MANIDPALVWAISSAVVVFIGLAWLRSYQLGGYIKGIERDVQELFKDGNALADQVKAHKRDLDVSNAAQSAAIALQKDQIAEFRQAVSERYATREAMADVEKRMTSAVDRVHDRLDQIGDKLEKLGNELLRAIAERR